MVFRVLLVLLFFAGFTVPASAAAAAHETPAYPAKGAQAAQFAHFPKPLPLYQDNALGVLERLESRAQTEPFNLIATAIFILAICHTFMAGTFAKWSHRLEEKHQEHIKRENLTAEAKPHIGAQPHVSFPVTVLHYLGEVEAIFMIWAIPLLISAFVLFGWHDVQNFVGIDCDFREPLFVVIIMTISASRPVVRFAERCLGLVANRLGGGTPGAWWLTVLILAPIFGSLITEPAAMTIGALLLARRFYAEHPPKVFAYATLGLLFVNISVGGVLTNFAAPPVLMVASKWEWSSWFMFTQFGWRSVVAILLSTGLYWLVFRKQLKQMKTRESDDPDPGRPIYWHSRLDEIPRGITLVHLGFLAWTVLTNHYPPLYLGGFLFFLGFMQATKHHQNPMELRGPLLVGFFLAGLVIHGRCQGWWLEPILAGGLSEMQLLLGSAALTAFNDNALITFLASQVPDLDDNMKYAIMAGAVAGGGLTVIANAPNPAGQGLLKSYFGGNVSPLGLLAAALVPTAIVIGCYTLTH